MCIRDRFGVAGYTYKNRYTVSFNARTDGSNRFGLKTNDLDVYKRQGVVRVWQECHG